MFGIGPATRIYLATGSTDMRKGFEGLFGLVRDRLSWRSAERARLCVFQRTAQSAETAVLGWQRALDMRQAPGEGTLPLA